MEKEGLECPDCYGTMHAMELEGVEVDLCRECSGLWLDRGELAKASKVDFDDTFSAEAASDARKSRRTCPTCKVPLWRRSLAHGAAVVIDQCAQCGGIFLDEGELSRIQAHLKIAQSRPEGDGFITAGNSENQGTEASGPTYLDEDSIPLAAFQILTGLPLEVGSPQAAVSPMTTPLLLANLAAFGAAMHFGFQEAIDTYGLVPAEVAGGGRLWTLFSSMFMHAGVFHLLGNMYFLFVAGDNVERRLGSLWFLPFYLACGLAAGLAHVISDPSSTIPTVGASGAISGVMGAYMVFFPRNRFLFRWFYWMRIHTFEVPAIVYFGFWVLLQILFATAEVGDGVAFWAHIGGFFVGAGIAGAIRIVEAQASPDNPRGWRA